MRLEQKGTLVHLADPRIAKVDTGSGKGVPSFAETDRRTIELHLDSWRAGSPLPEQWESTFRLHAAPLLVERLRHVAMGRPTV